MGKYCQTSNVWTLALLRMMWISWREHNNHTFKGLEITGDQLLALLVGIFDAEQVGKWRQKMNKRNKQNKS